MALSFPKVAQLKSVAALRARFRELGAELPIDDQICKASDGSPLAQPGSFGRLIVGNRWCIHPMEGWDAEPDGNPSELTLRRWRHFGLSGAKLIWGGEAAAVQGDGRANPRQTMATLEHRAGLARLRSTLIDAHRERFGSTDGLVVGLQLTHSGRFSRPLPGPLRPRIAYHHPLLDAKFGIAPDDRSVVWTDDDLRRLADRYIEAAGVARDVGFQFVDVKCCHGYLLHEFLSARRRPGPYGGDLAGRSRLLLEIIGRIRAEYPDLEVGVRLSLFDTVPFEAGPDGGRPVAHDGLSPYEFGFGVDPADPTRIDLSEPFALLERLREAGVAAVNLSCASPYYNPHLLRPAAFPPSDGYPPPEDPLVGVARQIHAARDCKQAVPRLPLVGSGYTYLQDYVPQVAQAVVRQGWIDFVGIGRAVLSYPELPADCLERGELQRKRVCRTFSDCTTGPRKGIISGCFPLDPFYKARPEAEMLKAAKE